MNNFTAKTYLSNCNWLLLSLLITIAIGCEKRPPSTISKPVSAGRKAMIINEGAYGNGNASVSLLNLDDGTLHPNYYEEINGESLGDVLQSATIINDNIFLLVNSSNKIVVIDKHTFKKKGSMPIAQPRYLYPFGDSLALVSSFYYSKIHVINTQTFRIVNEIQMPYQHTEQLWIEGNHAYACNWNANNTQLYKISLATLQIIDSIGLAGKAPHSIFKDKRGKLWVFGGNKEHQAPASISIIENEQLSASFVFDSKFEIVKPHYDSASDYVYYINIDYLFQHDQGIYRMSGTSNTLPNMAFVPAEPHQYFYGISIDPKQNHVYIANPKGFTQNGVLDVYDNTGAYLRSIQGGLGTSKVYFFD